MVVQGRAGANSARSSGAKSFETGRCRPACWRREPAASGGWNSQHIFLQCVCAGRAHRACGPLAWASVSGDSSGVSERGRGMQSPYATASGLPGQLRSCLTRSPRFHTPSSASTSPSTTLPPPPTTPLHRHTRKHTPVTDVTHAHPLLGPLCGPELEWHDHRSQAIQTATAQQRSNQVPTGLKRSSRRPTHCERRPTHCERRLHPLWAAPHTLPRPSN